MLLFIPGIQVPRSNLLPCERFEHQDIGVLMGHRRRKCHKLNGEQPQKSFNTPDTWAWRRVVIRLRTSLTVSFFVPHGFPAQKILLEM